MGSINGVCRGKYNTLNSFLNEFFCSKCGKKYKRRYSLLHHIRSIHLKMRTKCLICTKKFTSKSVQTRHLKKVHGINLNLANSSSNFAVQLAAPLKKLSHGTDEAFPHMSGALTLKESKKFGKHVVTRQDLAAGDMVIATSPFASIEYLECSGDGCFECGKASTKKIECPRCINVWFCSNRCTSSRVHRVKCLPLFERQDCRKVRLATEIINVAINRTRCIQMFFELCRAVLLLNKPTQKYCPPYSEYG